MLGGELKYDMSCYLKFKCPMKYVFMLLCAYYYFFVFYAVQSKVNIMYACCRLHRNSHTLAQQNLVDVVLKVMLLD